MLLLGMVLVGLDPRGRSSYLLQLLLILLILYSKVVSGSSQGAVGGLAALGVCVHPVLPIQTIRRAMVSIVMLVCC